MKINEIQSLIRLIAESGISAFELQIKDFTIRIKNPRPGNDMRAMATPVIARVNEIAPDIH